MFPVGQGPWNCQNQGYVLQSQRPGQQLRQPVTCGEGIHRYALPSQTGSLSFAPPQRMQNPRCWERALQGPSPHPEFGGAKVQHHYGGDQVNRPGQNAQTEIMNAPTATVIRPMYKGQAPSDQLQIHYQPRKMYAGAPGLLYNPGNSLASVYSSQRVPNARQQVKFSPSRLGCSYSQPGCLTQPQLHVHHHKHVAGSEAMSQPFGAQVTLSTAAHPHLYSNHSLSLPSCQTAYPAPIRNTAIALGTHSEGRSSGHHQNQLANIDLQQPVLSSLTSSNAGDASGCDNFNLDSLLGGAMGSSGSFMQQLEDVSPSSLNSTAVAVPDESKALDLFDNAASSGTTQSLAPSFMEQNGIKTRILPGDKLSPVFSSSFLQTSVQETIDKDRVTGQLSHSFPGAGLTSEEPSLTDAIPVNTSTSQFPPQNLVHCPTPVGVRGSLQGNPQAVAHPKIHQKSKHYPHMSNADTRYSLYQSPQSPPLALTPRSHFRSTPARSSVHAAHQSFPSIGMERSPPYSQPGAIGHSPALTNPILSSVALHPSGQLQQRYSKPLPQSSLAEVVHSPGSLERTQQTGLRTLVPDTNKMVWRSVQHTSSLSPLCIPLRDKQVNNPSETNLASQNVPCQSAVEQTLVAESSKLVDSDTVGQDSSSLQQNLQPLSGSIPLSSELPRSPMSIVQEEVVTRLPGSQNIVDSLRAGVVGAIIPKVLCNLESNKKINDALIVVETKGNRSVGFQDVSDNKIELNTNNCKDEECAEQLVEPASGKTPLSDPNEFPNTCAILSVNASVELEEQTVANALTSSSASEKLISKYDAKSTVPATDYNDQQTISAVRQQSDPCTGSQCYLPVTNDVQGPRLTVPYAQSIQHSPQAVKHFVNPLSTPAVDPRQSCHVSHQPEVYPMATQGCGKGAQMYLGHRCSSYHVLHQYSDPYGSCSQLRYPYHRQPDYAMESDDRHLGARTQCLPDQEQGSSPRQILPQAYPSNNSVPPGWQTYAHLKNNSERTHCPEQGRRMRLDSIKSGKRYLTSGTEGEVQQKRKKEKTKHILEVKGSQFNSEPSAVSPRENEKASSTRHERKRKKPPATLKLKKKKQKKGDDCEEFDGQIPVDEVSQFEKRRSARNVKRKHYTEGFDCQLSDDISGGELDSSNICEKQHADPPEICDDQMVVEKILDVRIRKRSKSVHKKESQPALPSKRTTEVSEAPLHEAPKPLDYSDNSPVKGSFMNEHLGEKKQTITADKSCFHETEGELGEKVVGFEEVEEYFVKYKNYSYLHCEWKTAEELQDKRAHGKIKRYKSKLAAMPEYLKADLSEAFNPDYVEVERVLDVMHDDDAEFGIAARNFLVKWCSLPYEESTWERESDIPTSKIQEFEQRCQYRPPDHPFSTPLTSTFRKLTRNDGIFLNDNKLRDYQLDGVNWLLFNWYNGRNCILADEMGLGKTIQSITFLQKVFDHGMEGPFLVVAPLSTICNWQREFSSWTKMNAVVYHGSQISRDMIKTYEFLCRDENLDELPGKYKVHVVVTTYEMVVLENSHLKDIQWKCSIIDEAHRLKNQSCKLAEFLRSMHLDFKVLLTGTPLQNNIEELFALLNFLQPEMFSCTEALIAEFGNMKDNTQVEKLQELLKPIMLRRLKEDVEKSLAPKEETIIEVELTAIQKKYYRAIMERNFEFLSKGAVSGNVPNLMNTMMELRKCCNHPYLIKGAEDKIITEQSKLSSLQLMIQSSGKLVLIDKLLPKLRSSGHKVLIFSQMVRCLDILEDYLVQSKYSYERIDGGIRGSERQAAIDRFSRPNSERFIFLLCTRAGGLGINLTAADTVIIFDSDWNPQNDLQAQARCHRIGQTKTVKIYRLITRNSYEREMFDKASLKLGLDKAVLQSISGRQDDVSQNAQPSLSKQEVESLLKLGAYGAIMDEDDDSRKFCEEDIDQILLRRTQKITIAPGQKGSTFSKASFVTGEEGSEISLNDPDFWEKWAKKADISLNLLKNNKLIIEEPRRRKQTRRFGGMTEDVEVLAEIGSESDSDYDEKPRPRTKKSKTRMKNWAKRDFVRLEKNLLAFGWGRWMHMLVKGGFSSHVTVTELEAVCRAVLLHCLNCYSGDERLKVFVWGLIAPTNCSTVEESAAVHANFKGRSADDDGKSGLSHAVEECIKETDVNSILQDESFRKHLQHHCTKILQRIRMLHFIKSEIMGTLVGDINDVTAESFELNLPDIIPGNTLPGWDLECDKNLLLGVFKHGYGKYSLIRADPKLCFKIKYGMPDSRNLADDMDHLIEDDNEDPEYKPARLNFSEYSEFEDSPASITPGTTPSSPASSMDSGKETRELYGKGVIIEPGDKRFKCLEMHDANAKNRLIQLEVKQKSYCGDVVTLPWPTSSELNNRVRRIVACYQKHLKQIRSRLMNIDQNSPKFRGREMLKERTHWTRREEADFYRTISTFGVEFTEKGFSWARFRQLAKLEKKSDRSLDMYYVAFKTMCEKVCGHKSHAHEDISVVPVTKITEERASRTLYRIELLNRIRLDVLRHEDLESNLENCEHSPDLPAWWKPGYHDKDLLIGMDKHGLTRTGVYILNDPTLSFSKSITDYEQSHGVEKLRRGTLTSDSSPKAGGRNSEGKSRRSKVEKIEYTPEELGPKKTPLPNPEDGDSRPWDQSHSQKWPKDRILIQRVEHVCYCVIHGRWPIFRIQSELNSIDSRAMMAVQVEHSKPVVSAGARSHTSVGEQKLFMTTDGHCLDDASSKILSLLAGKSDFKDDCESFVKMCKSQGNISTDHGSEIVNAQKLPVEKKNKGADETTTPDSANALLNLCLSSSKFNESLQTFLESDLPRSDLLQKAILADAMQPQSKAMKWPNLSREKFSSSSSSKLIKTSWSMPSDFDTSKKTPEKGIMKKKILKSKTGFISPAVLPSSSRIPVYSPSEKKKLTGPEAPLNKDLADWLKLNPGFIVDYKSLRQQLGEEQAVKENSSTRPVVSTKSSSLLLDDATQRYHKVSRDRTPPHEHEREHDSASFFSKQKRQEALSEQELQLLMLADQMNLLNQQLLNPSARLLNALYGSPQDVAALITSTMMPSFQLLTSNPAKNLLLCQSASAGSPLKHPKNCDVSGQQFTEIMPPLDIGTMHNPAVLAALAEAATGYTQLINEDLQKQLKQFLAQPSAQFDTESLPCSGLRNPFFHGFPGSINPLLYGMYQNPEMPVMLDLLHPSHKSFFETDYAKLKASAGETTPIQTVDFDDNLRSVYQQLHASATQKDLCGKKTSEDGGSCGQVCEASSSKDESPVDLRKKDTTKAEESYV